MESVENEVADPGPLLRRAIDPARRIRRCVHLKRRGSTPQDAISYS
jgi:hypothetical protein